MDRASHSCARYGGDIMKNRLSKICERNNKDKSYGCVDHFSVQILKLGKYCLLEEIIIDIVKLRINIIMNLCAFQVNYKLIS